MGKKQLSVKLDSFLNKHFTGESINYHQVISIILPILVDQFFIVCLSFVNTAMISSSGVAAVSAVNMVDSVNIFLVNVFVAVATGGTVVVAQYKGSGNDRMVSKAASGAISSVFLLAVFISLLMIVFHNPVLGVLFGGAEAAVFTNARIYLIGCAISYPFIGIVEAVCGALRGVGETKSSLVLSLIMNLSYVILNFLFINTLKLSVFGMVLSLNSGRVLAAICSIVFLLRFNHSLNFHVKDLLAFDFSMLKRILYIGIPFAAEQMFFNGGKILTQTFIVHLGTYSMAVNAICGSFTLLFQIPANAISLSVVTVVGQCMGRRDIADARKFIKSFLVLASLSFAVVFVLIMPFFTPLVQFFTPPDAIIPTIFKIVVFTGIGQIPLWSISFITPGALRAAGDSRYTSVVAMLSMWLFRVLLGYILGIILGFGIEGVWLAMVLEWGVRGAVFMHRFHGDKWYQHHLID